MRRQERETKDREAIARIITSCACMRLGFQDNGQVYIVPLNFGYVPSQGRDTFYFHGAKEGRKMDLIRKNPCVGFEMDTNVSLKEWKAACGHSTYFQSIIGTGVVSMVEDPEEKRRGLLAIMKQNTGRSGWDLPDAAVDEVCVFKLAVEQLSCKEHRKD